MAELADALDLGSSGATRTCSSHASRTKMIFREYYVLSFFISNGYNMQPVHFKSVGNILLPTHHDSTDDILSAFQINSC